MWYAQSRFLAVCLFCKRNIQNSKLEDRDKEKERFCTLLENLEETKVPTGPIDYEEMWEHYETFYSMKKNDIMSIIKEADKILGRLMHGVHI